jgi:hypothetical protein
MSSLTSPHSLSPRLSGKRTHFCSWKRTLDLRTLV